MNIFEMVSNVEFEAENIDDVFIKLSDYFKNMADGEDDTLFINGDISINIKESE